MGTSGGATRRAPAARSLLLFCNFILLFNIVCRYTTHTVGVVAAHPNAVHTHPHTTFTATACRVTANPSPIQWRHSQHYCTTYGLVHTNKHSTYKIRRKNGSTTAWNGVGCVSIGRWPMPESSSYVASSNPFARKRSTTPRPTLGATVPSSLP